jgi:hypothetical protein
VFKTFIAGVILGAAAAGAALYFIPIVDQVREYSLISVTPNGGTLEVFHANIPTDRIMVGAPNEGTLLPAGLDWPDDELFAHARTELFKIRDAKEAVVGVASRIAASDDYGDLVEWVLHLPARGSAYVLLQPAPTSDGVRVGDLRTGTQEFADLVGQVSERWIADTTGADDAPAGRIELQASFVSVVAEQPQ